jgi:hypothetical protein
VSINLHTDQETSYQPLTPATKQIKPALFIKLGVAEVIKGGSQAMQHGKHWKMLDEGALVGILNKLEKMVGQSPRNTFRLVSGLLGEQKAQRMVDMNYLAAPAEESEHRQHKRTRYNFN